MEIVNFKRVRIKEEGRDKPKYIGFICDSYFISSRIVEKHMYRGGVGTIEECREEGLASWGLDRKVAEGLEVNGVKEILLVTDKGYFKIGVDTFLDESFSKTFHNFREQFFAREKFFSKAEGDETSEQFVALFRPERKDLELLLDRIKELSFRGQEDLS